MIGRQRISIALGLAALITAVSLGAAPPAAADDCAAKCYAQENACRRATKDSPSCSAEVTRCLQSCRTQR